MGSFPTAKESGPFVHFTFLALDPTSNTYHNSDVVVLPVPYDATTSFKTGAREGPDAIIAASRELEDYDLELGVTPSDVGIYTSPSLETNLGSPEDMVLRIARAVEPVAVAGKVLALLGGDHSITVGAVQAMKAVYPDLSVLYLDAHADFRDVYLGTRWGHASTARRISELCPLTQVGTRSMSIEEMDAVASSNVRNFQYSESHNQELWDEVIDSMGPDVYVSVDLDVFDPSFMAAVGTPEPGGMRWTEVLDLIRTLAERRRIVGFDVVELSPVAGPPACSYIAAKLTYKLIAYSTMRGRLI
jgi:agmatinase